MSASSGVARLIPDRLKALMCNLVRCPMAKPKKTHEEIADDNERTNSMRLFNTAEAYWIAAHTLAAAKVKGGFADTPVRTLYYHAIELYLKALLRQYYGVDDLSKKFGHKIVRMTKEAEKRGLFIMDEDRDVFALMSEADVVIRSRYIRTGSGTRSFGNCGTHTRSLNGSLSMLAVGGRSMELQHRRLPSEAGRFLVLLNQKKCSE
jgi:hypothetical protein